MTADEEAAIAGRTDRMSAAELAAAWPRLEPGGAAAQAVALRLARVAFHRGERQVATAWLGRAGGGARGQVMARALADASRPDPRRVGVLLPLSGRHARLGKEMRLAIEIAAAAAESPARREGDEEEAEGDDETSRPAARPRRDQAALLRFYDTRGDGAEAERQVERAVRDGAVGLIGPVGQAEARAAASRASEEGIAIALLAPDQAGADPEVGVFRMWPAPEWEAEEAARLAVELGHDQLAVFAPRDGQGAAQSAAFQRAARAAGAAVVAAGDYDPAAKNVETDLKRFLGLDPATNERLRRHLAQHGRKQGWKSFSPDVAFDLLYVPDEHGPAALVAAYLPYFNIELRDSDSDTLDTLSLRRKHGGRVPSLVQLLGSSGWYHGGLAPRGGAAVEGALLVVPCAGVIGEAAGDQAAALAERFEARAGRPPGPLAAQAHDAALLFLTARAQAAGARDPRPDLTRLLRRAQLPDGACGPARILPSGQLERPATLLQVEGGEFIRHEL